MSTDNGKTIANRPIPRRPRWGWSAWEAVVGYIAIHHSPDATLRLQIQPVDEVVAFSASLTWGSKREDSDTYYDGIFALKNLWERVEPHRIFLKAEDAFRSPVGYADNQWFDETTQEAYLRLVRVTSSLFLNDWSLVVFYRPAEVPDHRIQIRLLTQANQDQRIVQSNLLQHACRQMLHQCALIYNARRDP